MLGRSMAVLAIVLCAACGGGGGGASSPPPVQTPPPTTPTPTAAEVLAADLVGLTLAEFYDASFLALSLRSPEGVISVDPTLIDPTALPSIDDLSEGYQRDTFAMYNVVLDALRTYDRTSLSDDEKLTYDFYEWHLQDVVDREEFFYYNFIATYNIIGVRSQTERFFTDIHPVETLEDAQDFLVRLNEVLNKFRDVANHLSLQSAAGIIEPQLTLDVAIQGLGNIADGDIENNPYFTAFLGKLNDIPGLTAAQRDGLIANARTSIASRIIPAYQELRQAMQLLRASAPIAIGVGQYPKGAEYYSYALRHHTTTTMTAAQIHQLGLDELARIHVEMRVLFDELGYPNNESLEQLYARVASDGGVIAAADVKATYESIIAAAQTDITVAFDIFPSTPVVVGDDPSGGFYIAPSLDGSRPGTFYAGTQNDQPYYQMPSLTYHESVPGHHTQIAIALDQDTVRFRRVLRFTAFSEGWALYAERLAWELNWYTTDTYGDLGRLQYEALRAARLVMDTGIHSLGWTFNQAAQFNQENIGASLGSSQGAAGRYSVWPGQATAYMIGMLRILEVRQRAMDELGSEFDLIEFHRVVVTNGGIPLALLDGVVDRYIAEKLSAP